MGDSTEELPVLKDKAVIFPQTEYYKTYEAKTREEADKKNKDNEKKIEEERRIKEERQRRQAQEETENRLREEEKRKKEEKQKATEKEVKTMKGKFGVMMTNLLNNSTTFEMTLSGVKLIDAQIRALVQAVENNKTLKCLSLNRKNISDEDGAEIIISLMKNDGLEKLELEGNKLGPKTAKEIANLLRINQTLKHINLENNNLTNSGKDNEGVIEIAKALGSGSNRNTTLVYLNMNNCNLKDCSDIFAQNMRNNETLILLDIENNKDLDYKHVRIIQDILRKNKKEIYDRDRLNEWKERKRMLKEEEDMDIYNVKEDYELNQEIFDTRYQAKLMKLQADLSERLAEKEYEKEKLMKKFEKEAAGLKKKKKGKKK